MVVAVKVFTFAHMTFRSHAIIVVTITKATNMVDANPRLSETSYHHQTNASKINRSPPSQPASPQGNDIL
jgi:hypothetical protein